MLKTISIFLNIAFLAIILWGIFDAGGLPHDSKDIFFVLLLVITPIVNLFVILGRSKKWVILWMKGKRRITSMALKTKLRLLSGVLFVLSGITGFFSIQIRYRVECMTRIMPPPGIKCSYIYYIWELIVIAILLFALALVLLKASFTKKKK